MLEIKQIELQIKSFARVKILNQNMFLKLTRRTYHEIKMLWCISSSTNQCDDVKCAHKHSALPDHVKEESLKFARQSSPKPVDRFVH